MEVENNCFVNVLNVYYDNMSALSKFVFIGLILKENNKTINRF